MAPKNGGRRVGSAAGTSEGVNSNNASEAKQTPDSTQGISPANREADQNYGRVAEGVHIAGYALERALQKLEWLLTGWSQGYGGISPLIESLTEPGELIVDPFAGTASWGRRAVAMGRRWLGADVIEGGNEEIIAEEPELVASGSNDDSLAVPSPPADTHDNEAPPTESANDDGLDIPGFLRRTP